MAQGLPVMDLETSREWRGLTPRPSADAPAVSIADLSVDHDYRLRPRDTQSVGEKWSDPRPYVPFSVEPSKLTVKHAFYTGQNLFCFKKVATGYFLQLSAIKSIDFNPIGDQKTPIMNKPMVHGFTKLCLFVQLALAFVMTSTGLLAAPYGSEGMPIEFTQPDGSKLSLRVFGDEFYGRTETVEGYSVVHDPATNSYEYAKRSNDGKKLISTGMKVGKANPAALGLAKSLDIDPDARRAAARARFDEWDKVTGNSKRWADIKEQQAAYEAAVEADASKTADGPSLSPPSFTTVGDKVGLTLLIDFPDAPGTIPQAEVINFLNGDNYTGYGNNGSVKKYFQDNSNNLLTYTNTVTAYVRMAQPKTYYNDITKDSGVQGRLLINDAIAILKALPNYESEILPTFETLTVDTSNRVIAFNVFFAGASSSKWSFGLWPHSWSLATTLPLSVGGKNLYKYQITNLGTSLTLGTFCHENGHMLCGYPDIYDYGYDSIGGAGVFCLMNSGGHGTNPVLINAYLKRASGWTTTTDITSASNISASLTATVGHADYNKIYRYANPAAPTTEYFLFENRQKTGRDAGIAASGIAIWHIDQLGNKDNQSLIPNTTHSNYECSLIQADNLWHFQSNTNSGDTKDLYYLGNTAAAYTNTFSDSTLPDANWWSGAGSGLNVYNFSSSGATMTLQFGLPPNTIAVLNPNGGELIYFDSTQEISWLSNTSGNVKIELYKAGVLHSVLSASEVNDGSYSWLVSSALPAASDYTIKISSVATPAYTDSSNATFSLATQPTLADALDTMDLTWTPSGNAGWYAQAVTSKDGIDAAQSGAIDHSQNSYVETTLAGPGTLTFWWKVSSETNYDFLRFYLNGAEQTGALARISGNVDWVQKTVSIPAGNQTVKWGYTKDSSVVANSDAAWVDQVVYTPTAAPEIAVDQPVGINLIDASASINCGSVTVSGSAAPVTFTVRNLGDANLTGLVVTKDGTHNADFALGALGSTTLAPGTSTTFTVTFTPAAAGARTAAIHIASNDADENPFDIALTGTGVTVGTLAVTPAENLTSSGSLGGPFSPSSLQYTLSNPGSTPINWTAVKTADWVTLSSAGGTMATGESTTVTVSINSNANALPINSYSDTVTFTNTTNGNGNTTRGVALTVNPIPATVTLGSLSQTYNGSPKSVSVTTNPAGLAHSVTYNGSATAPTDAGTYAVVATITAPNYVGSASGELAIAKASQSITFAALDPVTDTDAPFALTATASSGLTVSYTSSSEGIASVAGNMVTVGGIGTTTITATQLGNSNYQAALPVPQTLTVVRANPLAISGGPYKVLIGQSLSLNGSASLPSHGATITAYEWDLNNDGSFGDATGVTPPAISVAALTTTWGMIQGINEIQLKITDSAAKTSIVSTTVEVILSLTWDANNTAANRTDGTGAWLNANQWWDGSSNVTWASGSSATFGNTGAGAAVTLASPTSVNTLNFNVFTGTYTLGTTGQVLTLNGGVTQNSGSGAVQFVSPITLGAAQTWENNSNSFLTMGTSASSANVNNGGFTITANGTGTTRAFGSISGAGGIIKNGSGKLVLGGQSQPAGLDHTYTGTTVINAGVLQIHSGDIGTANIHITGGSLSHYYGGNFTRELGTGDNQIQITGGVSGFSMQGSSGTFTLSGTGSNPLVWGSAYFAPTEFILQAADANASAVGTFSNNINLNGVTRTVKVAVSRAVMSGAISNGTGTAGFIKADAGMLNLTNAASAWNGTTTINGGILDFGGINENNIGEGSARNMTVAAGAGVRFNTLSNAILNRIVESTDEMTVMTGTTANNLDFSSSTGANLPRAFLGCWASNGAKTEYSGTITPASDYYCLGGKGSSGLLGIVGTNKLTGTRGLLVGTTTGGGRVELAAANDFSGNTVIRTGARLTLSNNLAMQNSALDLGSTGGTFSLSDGTNTGRITGGIAAPDPTFGGLIGSRSLYSAFSGASGGNNETVLVATAVTGFTLNVGSGKSCTYTGAIGGFGAGATAATGGASILTKTGLGTQVLAGASTYTGATSVTEGTLLVNNTTGSGTGTGAVSISAAATLGGTGIIGGDTTIADTGKIEFDLSTAAASHNKLELATGKTLTFSGASVLTITSPGDAQTGSYTLLTAPGGISGVAPATLNLPTSWAATVSIIGNDLVLNVTSVGSLAVDHFAISSIASPQTIGTPITGITLTAQNASNQTATSFTGTVTFGGTAGITGTSASFVNGVLSGLSVTPTVAGSNLTFTVDDGASHTGSATFTVETLYVDWTHQIFANPFTVTTSTANPDGDNLTNLQEFAFGTDPTLPTLPPLAFAMDGNVTTPGAPRLMNFSASTTPDYRAVFTRRKDYVIAGLTYAVAFSADLNLWITSDTVPTRLTNANSTGDLDAVSVPFLGTVPLTGGGNAAPKFFRVSVD